MAEVNAKEYVGELVKRAKAAQKEFERTATDQLTIDKVVRAIGKPSMTPVRSWRRMLMRKPSTARFP